MTKRCCLLSVLALAALAPSGLRAQQNFFNVPSSDITPRGRVFFQQQLNNGSKAVQSASTFCYGLGKGWEIGANALGLTYDYGKTFEQDEQNKPYFPFFMLDAQKRFEFSERFGVAAGCQIGLTDRAQPGGYFYSNAAFETRLTKLVGGVFWMSESFAGPGSRNWLPDASASPFSKIGLQAGLERQIVPEKLSFQIDFLSGRHALGEVVPGLAWFFAKRWVLSAGFQIPTFGSRSVKAGVIEFTYVPK